MNQQGQQKNSNPKVEKAIKKCYRCQELGHFAAECPADKPVPCVSKKTQKTRGVARDGKEVTPEMDVCPAIFRETNTL